MDGSAQQQFLPFFAQMFSTVENILSEYTISSPAAHYLYRQILQKGPDAINDQRIAARTRQALKDTFELSLPTIVTIQKASDGTHKFLLQLNDGEKVEAVLLPFHKRYTICLSSQVGCKMACRFCFTATAGFTRHLATHEIVGQYLVLAWWARAHLGERGKVKPNIVFMGQGEPLDNFDAVKSAIQVLLQSTGIHLGPRQITLSTCGYLPSFTRLGELPPINIAISLHSPFDHVRSELIPINRVYPLADLFKHLSTISLDHRQYITFEYLLISNMTDRTEDAEALVQLITPFKSLVNLIPFNPFPGCSYQRPNNQRIEAFKNHLVEKKVRVMLRTTKGDEILAACGQLKGQNNLVVAE